MQQPGVESAKLKAAIAEWRESRGLYIVVRSWYFTPDSFVMIVDALKALRLIRPQVERRYFTQFADNDSGHPQDPNAFRIRIVLDAYLSLLTPEVPEPSGIGF